jgi:hypothetical protein
VSPHLRTQRVPGVCSSLGRHAIGLSRLNRSFSRNSCSRSNFQSTGGAGRRGRRDGIRRIGPVHPRQVMQRDTCAPAVGGCPDKQRQQHNHHRHAQHRMRTDHAEINQDDQHGNRQPIAEDGESPRITGITCEDQTADRTPFFKMEPPGKQSPFAAVRAALAQPAPERRSDQFRGEGSRTFGLRHPRIVRE